MKLKRNDENKSNDWKFRSIKMAARMEEVGVLAGDTPAKAEVGHFIGTLWVTEGFCCGHWLQNVNTGSVNTA